MTHLVAPAETAQISLLLVEDDVGHRELFQSHLRRCDGVRFDVSAVDRLAEGIAALQTRPFDAVLLDLRLPDSSGLKTLRRLRECSTDVAVVVLSALDDQELAVQAVHEGAQDYLVKSDLNSQLLSRAIRYAIERRRYETQLERLVEERTVELLNINQRLKREIEDHKAARLRIDQQQQELLQAERLAAIGEMVTGLAHESRNALQRSQACLSMLAYRMDHQTEARELILRAQEAQDDLSRLYDQLREYAAPIQLERHPHALDDLLREAWQQIEATRADRDTRLQVSDTQLDLVCNVDRFVFLQVFRNLLENALAACRDPVEITVSWTVEPQRNALLMSVRDNGPGFQPDHVRRVFEPFFTTRVRGTGLGLAITQRLVQAHGGEIVAANCDRGGAELKIILPRQGAAG